MQSPSQFPEFFPEFCASCWRWIDSFELCNNPLSVPRSHLINVVADGSSRATCEDCLTDRCVQCQTNRPMCEQFHCLACFKNLTACQLCRVPLFGHNVDAPPRTCDCILCCPSLPKRDFPVCAMCESLFGAHWDANAKIAGTYRETAQFWCE